MSDAFDQVNKDAASAENTAETGASAPETAEAAEKKKKTGAGKKLIVPAAIALCVLALVFAGLGMWGYSISVSGRNLPNVYVGGVAVGGMTHAETEAALDALDWDAAESRKLTVSLPADTDFEVGYVRAGMALGRDLAVDAVIGDSATSSRLESVTSAAASATILTLPSVFVPATTQLPVTFSFFATRS